MNFAVGRKFFPASKAESGGLHLQPRNTAADSSWKWSDFHVRLCGDLSSNRLYGWLAFWALSLAWCANSGCGLQSTGLRPPRVDAVAAGSAAIAQYDRSGDGTIDGSELEQVPAIKGSLDFFDTNRDKKVSADEIKARIESWQIVPVATMPLNCSVRVGRRPLAGATVVLEPEAFLGDQLKPATGVTDKSGLAYLSLSAGESDAPKFSGVQCGLYKVRITKLAAGKQSLPAKYNTDTQLGLEVAPDAACVRDGLRFDL